MSNRYDAAEDQHTGQPDCAECARVAAEKARDFEDADKLVNELMTQWDGMVGTLGQRLTNLLQVKGRKVISSVLK